MKTQMICTLLLINQGLSWRDSVCLHGMIVFHEGFFPSNLQSKTKQKAQNSKQNFTAEWR